jgi:ATPase subunit of ABC transporter with duplicated ATPase domains
MQLQINAISKEYTDRLVLNNISITIQHSKCYGLIGSNGSGKTTLLKIMAGMEKSDSGSVNKIPSNLSLGYVPQVSDFPENKIVTEILAESLNLNEDELYKIYIALEKLGISGLALKKFKELSTGQKAKIYLSRLIIETPDILLLDEPTNHLDFDSLNWLENYLTNYSGSYLIVSHDRRFLNNTVDTIFELENGKIKIYGGNYTFYREQKEIEAEAQLKNYVAQEKKVGRILEQVRVVKNKTRQLEARTSGSDFYVRKKAARSASKAKSAEKMLYKQLDENGVEKPKPNYDLSVLFKPKKDGSQVVVYLDRISLSFGRQIVFNEFSLVVNKGDRIALIGSNGSGKSTLIRLILGQIKPDSGTVEIGNNIDIGFLPQENKILDSNLSLLNYLMTHSKIDETSAYKLAKRFLFSDEDLKTNVDELSSGQKSKLVLAAIMSSGANFIILDEPTNFLDITAREALEEALASYNGTLLVVSHDRYFLERINPNKTIKLDKNLI